MLMPPLDALVFFSCLGGLFVLIWLLALVSTALTHGESRPSNSDHQSEERRYWWHQIHVSWSNFGIGILALIAAIIAGGIGIFAYLESHEQTIAANKQIAVMKDTEEQQLRAYVFLESAQIKCCTEWGDSQIILKAKNFGSTPAQDYHYWACVVIRENFHSKLPFAIIRLKKRWKLLGPFWGQDNSG
jgi:hypothetical protein